MSHDDRSSSSRTPKQHKKEANERQRDVRNNVRRLLKKTALSPFELPDSYPPAPSGSVQEDAFLFLDDLKHVGIRLPHSTEDIIDEVKEVNATKTMDVQTGLLLEKFGEAHSKPIELTVVKNPDHLRQVLQKPFTVLLIPKASNIIPETATSLKDVAPKNPSKEASKKQGSVHNGNAQGEATSTTTLGEMCKVMNDPKRIETAYLNFLNIHNNLDEQFCPVELGRVNLLQRVRRQETPRKTRGRQTFERDPGLLPAMQSPEFLIVTSPHCVSGCHTDAAGTCTCIVIVEGCKMWCWAPGDRDQTRLSSLRNGAHGTIFPEGLVGVALKKGDCLIMSPGTVHAVYCAESTLMAGGFFYTAATYHITIDYLRLQLHGQILDNEYVKASDWKDHRDIMHGAESNNLFDEEQRELVKNSVGELLRSLGILTNNFTLPESKNESIMPARQQQRTNKRSRDGGDVDRPTAIGAAVSEWAVHATRNADDNAECHSEKIAFIREAAQWYSRARGWNK